MNPSFSLLIYWVFKLTLAVHVPLVSWGIFCSVQFIAVWLLDCTFSAVFCALTCVVLPSSPICKYNIVMTIFELIERQLDVRVTLDHVILSLATISLQSEDSSLRFPFPEFFQGLSKRSGMNGRSLMSLLLREGLALVGCHAWTVRGSLAEACWSRCDPRAKRCSFHLCPATKHLSFSKSSTTRTSLHVHVQL